MNIKLLQIDALNNQINALKRAIEMMKEGWGEYANQAGFQFCDSSLAKQLLETDYVCPFTPPINGQLKPLLMELYIQMTADMIKRLEQKLEKIENE
ncbi:hypothetical protein KNT65_gp166 [Escherichia phage EcS1]|uniref:Anti-restriction nuclease n=1 Tax=Escherichia phage EcS1 TaxID=2083276 RepID=A0A2Z5ZCV8_9CAUD|nr:hypothetical protein KNT65_gp166 [Escherichia phage EcS1]BBC78327.1 Hypothetical protein [Escherichia phage EcS1]